ncbi:hypothetical protein ACFP81_00650 [Deinococcus lacus]|uniref:Cell division protein FtsL n=1 Tax=Deinococcus lacus TaxID=392561 RepID=A0ABW1Y938_9DEIO
MTLPQRDLHGTLPQHSPPETLPQHGLPEFQEPAPSQPEGAPGPVPAGRREPPGRWARSEAMWRRRAVRLLLTYLALNLALLGLRSQTDYVRPGLLAARESEAGLTALRDRLDLEVQALSSVTRVRTWAQENGMRRFAELPKYSAEIGGVAAPAVPVPAPKLEIQTEWRP